VASVKTHRMPLRWLLIGITMLWPIVVGLVAAADVSAKVFASQKQALAEAFPTATRIERDTTILRKAELARITAITRDENPARVVVLHSAWKDDELLGYAHIDVHNVRTKPEAFMVVLTPEGIVRSVRILAFHEPLDYLPTDSWYAQFVGKTGEDRMRVGGDVHGVVGATLSARAAADGVRRMLAYWEVLLRPAELARQEP
jgi:transcriptional regulator of nitric oxide reductase